MLQTSDGETEILLGNKQLLGIFFVVVILLGVAFAGGYKVGQGSKKAGYPSAADQTASAPAVGEGETHAVAPDGTAGSGAAVDTGTAAASSAPAENEPSPAPPAANAEPSQAAAAPSETAPLGSSHGKAAKAPVSQPEDTEAPGPPPATPVSSRGLFTPQPGQTFLQVAAVGRDEAEGISDVLRKKGFRAHAVPKPGSTKLYRVIIGPLRDASDLSSTRAALRNTAGFREIIVQRY